MFVRNLIGMVYQWYPDKYIHWKLLLSLIKHSLVTTRGKVEERFCGRQLTAFFRDVNFRTRQHYIR